MAYECSGRNGWKAEFFVQEEKSLHGRKYEEYNIVYNLQSAFHLWFAIYLGEVLACAGCFKIQGMVRHPIT